MVWQSMDGYEAIRGRECEIIVQRRPAYCDRGRFVAQLFPEGLLVRDVDHADGWPRYYFDLARAKAEVEAWLVNRGQNR